jgi:hypothetical protein
LILSADVALYAAKNARRDRVEIAEAEAAASAVGRCLTMPTMSIA